MSDPSNLPTKYTPMNFDDIDKAAADVGFGAGGGQYFTFKAGRNVVRFLPGNGHPFTLPYQKHFVPSGPGGKSWGGSCPAKMIKGRCPVCQIAARLSRGTAQDRDLAERITAKGKYIAAIIDRSNPDAGPQLVEFGKTIFDQLREINRSLGEDFADPVAGFDVQIEKQGEKLNTEYKVSPMRLQNGKGALAITPLHTDARQSGDWLEATPNLTRQVTVQSEAEILVKLGSTLIGHMLSETAPMARKAAAPADRKQAARDDLDVLDSDDPY